MGRLVYACRFDVPKKTGFSPVLAQYSAWIERHYRERRKLPDFKYDVTKAEPVPALPAGHTIHREHFVGQKGEVKHTVIRLFSTGYTTR
jgi:hypothetical protein